MAEYEQSVNVYQVDCVREIACGPINQMMMKTLPIFVITICFCLTVTVRKALSCFEVYSDLSFQLEIDGIFVHRYRKIRTRLP